MSQTNAHNLICVLTAAKFVGKNLPHPPLGPKQDVHPKTPNPHLTIAGRKYQGVQLAVHRSPDSLVTDSMLARGAKGSLLGDKDVQAWIKDIEEGRYSIYVEGNGGQGSGVK